MYKFDFKNGGMFLSLCTHRALLVDLHRGLDIWLRLFSNISLRHLTPVTFPTKDRLYLRLRFWSDLTYLNAEND